MFSAKGVYFNHIQFIEVFLRKLQSDNKIFQTFLAIFTATVIK